MSGGGSKKSVVGYMYYRTMNMGLCHGPIDAVRSIWIKDKQAWTGNLRRNSGDGNSKTGSISWLGLFGGKSLEGGVKGKFEVGFGGLDQVLLGVNDDGTTHTLGQLALGVLFPYMPPRGTHYRGMAVVNFFDFYWGTNPYISDIAFEVESYWRGWFTEKLQIGANMNPAHIIYVCLTNDQWGLGYSAAQLDDDSFRVAAGKLYDEGLGLSQAWSETSSIEDFINIIADQIDATFYFSQKTGKWTLRLIRAGDPVAMELGPEICRLGSFNRRVYGETVNELVVRWVNPTTEEFQSLTVHDGANITATGQTVSGSKDFPGVRSESLAAKLGLRDLRALSATLASAQITANRKAWILNPGDLVDFSWPDRNIDRIRMRVTDTTHNQDTAEIGISLVEDVFGQALASFNDDEESDWVDTRTQPTQFDVLAPFELPYWWVFQALSGVAPAAEVTYGAVLPVSTNVGVLSVDLNALSVTPSASTYSEVDIANVTPSALLSVALVRGFTSTTTILISSLTSKTLIEVDSFVVLGSGPDAEIARVVDNIGGGTFVLERGLMDTHPQAWPIGTRIFFLGREQFPADPTARSMFETVNYKVTMQTSLGKSEVDEVPPTTFMLEGRQGRPYPVANVKIEGSYWPSLVTVTDGYLRVTFNTRNRLLQNGDDQILWNEGSILAEPGTSVLVFAMQGGAVVSSVLVPDPAVGFAELPITGIPSGTTTIVARAIRDGLDNYQDFTHEMTLSNELLSGWGADWGTDWGD